MRSPTSTAVPAGADTAFAKLRALRVAADEGWIEYRAGEPADDLHVVDVDRPGAPIHRTLLRGEAYHWCLGLADGHGHGQLVRAVLEEPVPDLVSLAAAAASIPAVGWYGRVTSPWMTVDGIEYHIRRGTLYPIYVGRRVRYLFADQVRYEQFQRAVDTLKASGSDADSSAEVAQHRRDLGEALRAVETSRSDWMSVRRLLPLAVRPAMLGDDLAPKPSPDPLPIPRGNSEDARRIDALMVGHRQGWFSYTHPLDDGRFAVDVLDAATDDQIRVELPGDGVLPWVGGVADRHGRMDLVAWRDGLG